MDFRFDIEATDSLLNDANWIAFKWVKRLQDVKADKKYSNTKNLKSNYRIKIYTN